MCIYTFFPSIDASLRSLTKWEQLVGGVIAVVTVCLTGPAAAQDQDEQLWLELGADVPLAENISLNLETNQRFSSAEGGLYESQYLAAIGVKIADGVKLTGGINRVVALEDGNVDATEWRPRQQIGFPIATIGRGALKGQLRLEQRFRSDSDDVGNRVRPKVVFEIPLRDVLTLEIAHESYFNLNTTDFGQQSGHERMRNSATLGFSISDRISASLGYMNQYRFNPDTRDLMEHALTSGLLISF